MWIRLLGAAPRRDGSGRGAVASSYDSATCGVVVAWAPGLVVSVGVWGERAGRRPGCPTLATSSERRGAISAVCECGETEGGALALALYYLFAASLAVSRRAGQRRSAACRAQKMAGTCRAGRGRVTGVHVTRRDQRGSGPVAFRLSLFALGEGARRIRGHGSFLQSQRQR